MKKIIKITESQLNMLTENRVSELDSIYIAKILESISCTGETIKRLINKKLTEHGFNTINIKFLGYGENRNILQYIVYTEGPIFVVNTISKFKNEKPCMEVTDVISYVKA